MADWFTIAEARALKPLDNATNYPDAAIADGRALAQSALEDACGIAFTPTDFTDAVVNSVGCASLYIRPRLTDVLDVTLNGVSQSLTGLEIGSDGIAYLASGWPSGRLLVSGTAGYPAPPPRVKRAALLLTKYYLVESGISSRTMRHTNAQGESDVYVTEGRGGAVFPLPEANAIVDQYGIRPGLLVA